MTNLHEPSTSSEWQPEEPSDDIVEVDAPKRNVHDLNAYIDTFTSDEGSPFTNGYAMYLWRSLGKNTEKTVHKLNDIIRAKGGKCTRGGLSYRLKRLQQTVFLGRKNINTEWTRLTDLMHEMFTLPQSRPKRRKTPAPDSYTDNASTGDFFATFSQRMDVTDSSASSLQNADSSKWCSYGVDSPTVNYKTCGSSAMEVNITTLPKTLVAESSPKLEQFTDNASTVDFFTAFAHTADLSSSPTPARGGRIMAHTMYNKTDRASPLDLASIQVLADDKVTNNSHQMKSFTDSSQIFDAHRPTPTDLHSGVDPTLQYRTNGSTKLDDFTTEDPDSERSKGPNCCIF